MLLNNTNCTLNNLFQIVFGELVYKTCLQNYKKHLTREDFYVRESSIYQFSGDRTGIITVGQNFGTGHIDVEFKIAKERAHCSGARGQETFDHLVRTLSLLQKNH